MSVTAELVEEELINKVAKLLAKKGIKTNSLHIKPCSSGGNNRVFLLYAGDNKFLLKNYYSSALDKRNRLQHEWAFLKYTEEMGVKCVPKTIVHDQKSNIGVYEFVEGKKLSASEINVSHIQDAICP